MWLDNDSPGCKYDTVDCRNCGACKPSPLDVYLENDNEREEDEMKVKNIIEVYEVDGEECKISSKKPKIILSNHWNKKDFINIKLEDGKKYTILARELQAAINNATNTARY